MDYKAIATIYYVMLKCNGLAQMVNYRKYDISGYRGRVDIDVKVDFVAERVDMSQHLQIHPINTFDSDEVYYV